MSSLFITGKTIETLAASFLFALAFIFGSRLHRPGNIRRRSLLSFSAGAAVAYIFVHLSPEIEGARKVFVEETAHLALPLAWYSVDVATMVGKRHARRFPQADRCHPPRPGCRRGDREHPDRGTSARKRRPLMATIIAIRIGLKDAKEGKPYYAWTLLTHPEHRRDMLRDGWKSVSKVFVVAIIIDLVYQLIVLRWFYPFEAFLVAVILAFIPYLIIRGPVNRMARRKK